MNSAQRENLIKLHRLAAYRERAYHTHVASGANGRYLEASRQEWEEAESDLATYRDYLLMLRVRNQLSDGRML